MHGGRSRMRRILASAFAAALLAANPPPPLADDPSATPPRGNSAIVGGRHVQPRANSPSGAPDSDASSKRDAEDVDRLYRELMQTAPDPTRTKGLPPQ